MRGDGRPLVGITMGDPNGIGPEIVAAGHAEIADRARPIVVGDPTVIRRAVERCGTAATVRAIADPDEATADPSLIHVLDVVTVEEHEWGALAEAAGAASLACVERAIDLAIAGTIDAIVTAPINKQATRLAGAEHAGHTELLADRTGTDAYAMLLVDGPLRVSHVSTHVPLRRACDLVAEEAVLETIHLTADGVSELGVAEPRLAVAGLNPHAGDGGLLGTADTEEIAPAVDRARAAGIDVAGPMSPDAVFREAAAGGFDAVVAMYHDQGHIPVKLHGVREDNGVSGVNVTLGLPIVRTSVDHGTAFDIAGEGVASARSLIQAVEAAVDIVEARRGE